MQNMRDGGRNRPKYSAATPVNRYRMLWLMPRLRPIKLGATKPSNPTTLRSKPAIIVIFLIINVFHFSVCEEPFTPRSFAMACKVLSAPAGVGVLIPIRSGLEKG